MTRILVTPRSLSQGCHPSLAPLTQAGFEIVAPRPGQTPSEADLIRFLPGCIGWIAGVEPVSQAAIDAATDLRVISRNGTGVDNLPMSVLEAKNITVCRAQATNARGVAELALTMALAGLRQVVPTHLGMKSGDWTRQIGREMQGAQVGVLGLGAIGKGFAEFCLGLGAHVKGYDPFAPGDTLDHPNFTRVDLDVVFDGADVVSLHAPMPENGQPLIQAAHFARLAAGGVVVNTARAGLVDKVALLAALETGQVGTYATDVFDEEPPAPSKLLAHPRVILTSHIGGFTKESVERSTDRAVQNLLEALLFYEH
ncbi:MULTISPECIES: phosphoglycerate dehydrogenase [Pacificibacter]|uniref:phosphoglycerate dehydrogenase n=1 Tax=Pacificibacter TaxID=1042323 RepID=UPI001C092C68|nr:MULTISPECIES: phosphoglycerate dehydrogenase [Pacificibacter]MBU2937156.1 phosphoglycerate dehydrogenase [Pacificibacter marinus]MDO6617024.1 phosphoglycerate dehydrogenase [Pacificibacter sp. 1_MG-2023]